MTPKTFTYIVECGIKGLECSDPNCTLEHTITYYVGSTDDLHRRIQEHLDTANPPLITCRACKGTGRAFVRYYNALYGFEKECSTCKGSGKVLKKGRGAKYLRGKTILRIAYTEHVDDWPESMFKKGREYDNHDFKRYIVDVAFGVRNMEYHVPSRVADMMWELDNEIHEWRPAWRRCDLCDGSGKHERNFHDQEIYVETCPKCNGMGGEWLVPTHSEDCEERGVCPVCGEDLNGQCECEEPNSQDDEVERP